MTFARAKARLIHRRCRDHLTIGPSRWWSASPHRRQGRLGVRVVLSHYNVSGPRAVRWQMHRGVPLAVVWVRLRRQCPRHPHNIICDVLRTIGQARTAADHGLPFSGTLQFTPLASR